MSQVLPERQHPSGAERSEPLGDLDQMTERMRRLLDQMFGRFGAPTLPTDVATWSPLVDIEERDDAYVVDADLPGVKPEDVDIELVGNELAISGEVKEDKRDGVMRRRTRRIGRFNYRVTLPEQVDAEQIDAKLENGVLKVRVPKSERAKRRRIEIKSS